MVLSDYIDSSLSRVSHTYDSFCIDICMSSYRSHLVDWANNKQPLVSRLGIKDNELKVEFPLVYTKGGNSKDIAHRVQDMLHTLRESYKILCDKPDRYCMEKLGSLLGFKIDHVELYGKQIAKYLSKDRKKLKVGKQEIKLLSVFKMLEKQFEYDREALMKFTNTPYQQWFFTKMQQAVEKFTESVAVVNIKDTLVISIDPVDFVLASENTNGWQSCFRVEGEYHASTNSFLRASNIAIAYILDNQGKKKYRQWVVLGDNYFSKGRSYPDVCEVRNKAITKVLKDLYKGGKSFTWYKEVSPLSGADGVYLDPFQTWHHHKSKFDTIDLEDGLSYDGYSTDGYFTDGNCCGDCGERHHQDDLYWSEWHECYIGECCIGNYAWCEDVDTYVHLDYCRYLVDRCEYVSEDCSYCVYLEDADEWVSDRYEFYYAVDADEYYNYSDNLYYAEDTGDYYKYNDDLYLHSDDCWYTYEEEKEVEEC